MKKLFIICLSLLFLPLISMGMVTINFNTAANTLKDHNLTPLNIGAQSLVLAYWSLDNSASGFNAVDPTNPTGGDVLLGAFATGAGAGRITGQTADNFGTGSGLYSPGFVYIAVFEQTFASYSGSIAGGTYYGVGPTLGSLTPQFPSPSVADTYSTVVVSPITTSLQVVPEPSTVGLLIVGLGVLGFRRMRRK